MNEDTEKLPLSLKEFYYDLSLETLRNMEVKRLKNLILMMKSEGRLCSETSASVIVEFGFKGDFESVKQQLWEFRENIKQNGLQESDRDELFVRRLKRTKWMNDLETDPYMVRYNAIRKQSLSDAIKILDEKRISQENLHNRKECLCFTNL